MGTIWFGYFRVLTVDPARAPVWVKVLAALALRFCGWSNREHRMRYVFATIVLLAAAAAAYAQSSNAVGINQVVRAEMVRPSIIEVAVSTDNGPTVLRMSAYTASDLSVALARATTSR